MTKVATELPWTIWAKTFGFRAARRLGEMALGNVLQGFDGADDSAGAVADGGGSENSQMPRSEKAGKKSSASQAPSIRAERRNLPW